MHRLNHAKIVKVVVQIVTTVLSATLANLLFCFMLVTALQTVVLDSVKLEIHAFLVHLTV